MKYLKALFLLALFNYLIVGAVVLALKQTPANLVSAAPIALVNGIPTLVPTQTIALTPTLRIVRPKPTPTLNPDPFAMVFNSASTTNTIVNNQPQPTSPPTVGNPTSPPAAAPTVDSRCIISIDGQRYDVTVFKTIHSGGNIFTCGADMSAIFHNQHPVSYLQMIAQYKI